MANTSISFIDLLLKKNKQCYDWFNSMDELKKARVIEETFNMVYKIGNYNNSNAYTLGFMQECKIEEYLTENKYKFTNSSKDAKSGDFIVSHNGVDIIIESKNYTTTISYSEVDKLIRDMDRLNLSNAIFISNTKVSKIKDKIQFCQINGKNIYFINTDSQPVNMFNNVLDMCIQSLSSLKFNYHILNESIPELVKRLSKNMSLLYDFKDLLSDTKLVCLKRFDMLEKNINIYEFEIRKNIDELISISDPILSDKSKIKELLCCITDVNIKNFVTELVDGFNGELSESNNSIYFGGNVNHVQLELRKRKPLFRFKINDDSDINIKSDWELKNKIIVIPFSNESKEDIRKIILA
jgi:hypothetical protein